MSRSVSACRYPCRTRRSALGSPEGGFECFEGEIEPRTRLLRERLFCLALSRPPVGVQPLLQREEPRLHCRRVQPELRRAFGLRHAQLLE